MKNKPASTEAKQGNKLLPMTDDAMERYIAWLGFKPHQMAWRKITEMIFAAKNDPVIYADPAAVEFLEVFQRLASEAWRSQEVGDAFEPLVAAIDSDKASRMASRKNEAPRAWVASQWTTRTDRAQSKNSFARQYAPLVKKNFDLIVTPETIARDWLPKANQ